MRLAENPPKKYASRPNVRKKIGWGLAVMSTSKNLYLSTQAKFSRSKSNGLKGAKKIKGLFLLAKAFPERRTFSNGPGLNTVKLEI